MKNIKNQFDLLQLNKTYAIEFKTKENKNLSYNTIEKIYIIEKYEDKIVYINTQYSKRSSNKKTLNLNELVELEVSALLSQDWTDEYLTELQKEIFTLEEDLKKAKKELAKREEFVKNRSFLGKVINFFKF